MKRILNTFLLAIAGVLLLTWVSPSRAYAEEQKTEAKKVEASYRCSSGADFANGHDGSYDTASVIPANGTLTVTTKEKVSSIYIEWNRIPGEWILSCDGKETTYGKNDFLHEYVEIPEGTNEFFIKAKEKEVAICNLSLYTKGELPADVQKWNPPCEKADILVYSTHSDDEILFLGGVLCEYAGNRKLDVQIAYMCEFWTTTPVREHEKLNGIWHCGVTNYPVCGDFKDIYSRSLDHAKTVYVYNDLVKFVSETIERFQPLVTVSQDFNGEYGHGGHMIYAAALAEALENSSVKKAYYHLYGENQIQLDVRTPIENFGGKTAFDVASEAYQYHKSQLWCAFYVSDGDASIDKPGYAGSKYSIRNFGLYKTAVGPDVNKNDMMENLKSYKQMAAEEEEKARMEEEKARQEEERKKMEEEQNAQKLKASQKSSSRTIVWIVVSGILLILIVIAFVIRMQYIRKMRRRKRRKKTRK